MAINKVTISGKRKNNLASYISLSIVFIVALLFLFPFYWMISSSFKPLFVAISIPPEWFPKEPIIDNYTYLFRQNTTRWFLNSFIVSAATTIMVLLTSSMAGYSLSKKKYPGRDAIFWIFVAVMTLPKQVLLVPLFIMMKNFNLFDTYTGLIIPAVGWPFGVFLMKQFTQTMPSELLQSAEIDGCTEWQKFSKIALPLVKPGLGALAIFTFMSSWNDYFWQLIMIKTTLMKTLPLGVASLQEEFSKNYGVIMAGSTLASLPMLVVFLVFQKYFTQGITLGAVKG